MRVNEFYVLLMTLSGLMSGELFSEYPRGCVGEISCSGYRRQR